MAAWAALAKGNEALTLKIREFYDQRMGVYGSPRILCDLRQADLVCGENQVARSMKASPIKSAPGYARPGYKVGKPALAAPNQLQRQFQLDEPNQAWVPGITYIRTHEGRLYVAAVLDLYPRSVVVWSMGARMQTSLVLDALTMAVWHRKPNESVIIHSDQGSQFGSDEVNRWCKDNPLLPSMRQRGNCWDNAVAEAFFSSLKKECVKRRVHACRQEAKSDVFDCIEGLYNRAPDTVTKTNCVRWHLSNFKLEVG